MTTKRGASPWRAPTDGPRSSSSLLLSEGPLHLGEHFLRGPALPGFHFSHIKACKAVTP
jgi:hypothetical protein